MTVPHHYNSSFFPPLTRPKAKSHVHLRQDIAFITECRYFCGVSQERHRCLPGDVFLQFCKGTDNKKGTQVKDGLGAWHVCGHYLAFFFLSWTGLPPRAYCTRRNNGFGYGSRYRALVACANSWGESSGMIRSSSSAPSSREMVALKPSFLIRSWDTW